MGSGSGVGGEQIGEAEGRNSMRKHSAAKRHVTGHEGGDGGERGRGRERMTETSTPSAPHLHPIRSGCVLPPTVPPMHACMSSSTSAHHDHNHDLRTDLSWAPLSVAASTRATYLRRVEMLLDRKSPSLTISVSIAEASLAWSQTRGGRGRACQSRPRRCAAIQPIQDRLRKGEFGIFFNTAVRSAHPHVSTNTHGCIHTRRG